MIFGYGYKTVAVLVPLMYILLTGYSIHLRKEAKKETKSQNLEPESETLNLKDTNIEEM